MSTIARTLAVLSTAGAAALALAAALPLPACGPPCIDDRCSLSAPTPQTTRVDYTKPKSGGTVASNSPGAGSATTSPAPGSANAAPVGTGSAATGSATPIAAGSGSANPATGSAAPAAGSGSAAPAKPAEPAVALSASGWELWSGNNFRMYVISKATVGPNTKITFEFVKTPIKTPFLVTLEVKPPGDSPASEGVWNDCPETKIKCDPGGTKTHVTKKGGQVLLQAGINWAVTGVSDEAKGTLVTWTNNLSREVFSLRLLK